MPANQQFVIKDAFRIRTLCLFGAIAQIGISTLVPRPWSFVPALALVLNSVVATLVQSSLWRKNNTFIAGVIPGRATAQLPAEDSGQYGSTPAARPLVVFHFGVRFNHPLGVLAPGAKETAAHFENMIEVLNQDRQDCEAAGRESRFGLLGASNFRGGERESHATLLYVLYFKDLEGLRRFADDPIHVRGWEFLRHSGHNHISAFHETFCVPAGSYETVYVNSPPVLLGETAVRCHQERVGGDEVVWMSPLVDASTPRLTTMAARLGQSV